MPRRELFFGVEVTAGKLLDLLRQGLRLTAALPLYDADQPLQLVAHCFPMAAQVLCRLQMAGGLGLGALVEAGEALDKLGGVLQELVGGGLQLG